MSVGLSGMDRGSFGMTSSVISKVETETKNIQNQIMNKQQNLKRISSDGKMSVEEKAKESQEIQKQIEELNRKLRMLQQEREEEVKEAEKKQEQKAELNEGRAKDTEGKASDENDLAKDVEGFKESVNVSPQNVQKMLEGSSVIQKERIQQSVSNQKELAVNVLESEIELDKGRGTDTTAKEAELADLTKATPFELKIDVPQDEDVIFGQKAPVKIIIKEDGI